MERNGFISEYDLMDNQRGLVSLFSNAQVENAQSMILSLVNMAGELKSNGHKLDSSHPMDIIKAWETWRKS